MPKVKALGLYAEKDIEFARAIEGCAKRKGKRPGDLMNKADIAKTTYYKRLKEPGSMTLRELRIFINEANIPEEDVLNALYLRRKA